MWSSRTLAVWCLLQILTALLDRAKQQQQGRALGSLAANTDFLQQLGIILLEAANEPGGTHLAEKTMPVGTQHNHGRLLNRLRSGSAAFFGPVAALLAGLLAALRCADCLPRLTRLTQ